MDTKLRYKISLGINTAISLLYILLLVVASFNVEKIEAGVVFIIVFIFGACVICLLFNYVCYRLLKSNKENITAPDWMKKFRIIFLVFTIIALLVITVMFIAAALSFFTDYDEFPKKQQPFYILFLLFMLALIVSGIENIVYYFKALKQNKAIVNSVINTIGEASSV